MNEKLDENFVSEVKRMKRLLQGLYNRCKKYDLLNTDEDKRVEFIDMNKEEIFRSFNAHFDGLGKIIETFDREKYLLHREYYQAMIAKYMLDPIEINHHIKSKPLGYAGDYMVMNYIYDYHKGGYLGRTTFEKLINHYTCNIDISLSNIKRKQYFKEKIMQALVRRDSADILSLGSGPGREIIELIEEGKINKPIRFTCLDLEARALEYIKGRMRKIPKSKKQKITIAYVNRNVIGLIRNKLNKQDSQYDLIYASGLFDYLNQRTASKLISNFYGLLSYGGELIICNADADNTRHRAYYEMLGEWELIYKTRQQMLSWTKGLKYTQRISFANIQGGSNYLFLEIKKQL